MSRSERDGRITEARVARPDQAPRIVLVFRPEESPPWETRDVWDGIGAIGWFPGLDAAEAYADDLLLKHPGWQVFIGYAEEGEHGSVRVV